MDHGRYSSYDVRMRAVNALVRGLPVGEVADAYGTDRTTLFRWMQRYREGGVIRTQYNLVSVGGFMKTSVPSLDPRNAPAEVFELWSIPAYDAGKPERK